VWRFYYYAGTAQIAVRVKDPTTENLYYLFADHLGSTNITSDPSGDQVSLSLYTAWGESRLSAGSSLTDYRFTGQRADDGIGLYFYNARWYDSSLGRFTSPDYIIPEASQGVQAWDRMAYANNNPILYNDPNGHCVDPDMCPDMPIPPITPTTFRTNTPAPTAEQFHLSTPVPTLTPYPKYNPTDRNPIDWIWIDKIPSKPFPYKLEYNHDFDKVDAAIDTGQLITGGIAFGGTLTGQIGVAGGGEALNLGIGVIGLIKAGYDTVAKSDSKKLATVLNEEGIKYILEKGFQENGSKLAPLVGMGVNIVSLQENLQFRIVPNK
jgi:RHS repeat-associated protein